MRTDVSEEPVTSIFIVEKSENEEFTTLKMKATRSSVNVGFN
jgi:hypothetical protein